MLHFVVGKITHGYNAVEHSTTGTNQGRRKVLITDQAKITV